MDDFKLTKSELIYYEKVARELGYDRGVIEKIHKSKNLFEISRILKTARLSEED